MVTEFERTLDELQGDGQSLLEEFVDWQAAGTTYSFNDLRNELCGDAKFKFDDANVWLFGLVYTCKDSKKVGLLGPSTLKISTITDIPKHWRNCLISMLTRMKCFTFKEFEQ